MPDEFLNRRHAEDRIPDEVLNALVNETVGSSVATSEQIVREYANEVYQVRTTTGDRLIVRIQQHGVVGFETEAWAMARCRESGIPVPHVHGITRTGPEQRRKDVMVLDQARGKSLAEWLPVLDFDQRAHVFQQVGAALRRIHGITLDDFGPLRSRGAGAGREWRDYVDQVVTDRRNDMPDLVRAGLDESEASALLEIVTTLSTYPCAQPVLCHGDLADEHIFIDEDLNVTGIIDFGMAQGGPGVLDIAVLLMFHPDVELAWLADGYGAGVADDARTRTMIVAHQANIGMSYLAHNTREGNHDSTEIALLGLRGLLDRR